MWAEKEPAINISRGDEYAYLRMLKDAIKREDLHPTEASKGRVKVVNFHAMTGYEMERDELKRFAESRDLRPKFLYPEERG